MYDYVEGKVDWMAHDLPVEGEAGPFVGGALIDVPTCGPHDDASDVGARLEADGQERAAVVTAEGIGIGLVRLDDLRSGGSVLDHMELVPDTIRPHVPRSSLDQRTAGRLVTTPQGRLLGAVDPAAIEHVHEVEHEVEQLVDDIADHFGDREPSPDEVRAYLRERLVEQGRSPEEADRLLGDMDVTG